MARNKSRGSQRMRGKAISNVRVVPDGEGNRAEKINRMIVAVKESQGQTRVVCRTVLSQGVASGDAVVTFNNNQLRATDDFVSLAQQYATCKVAGMRFDIFDQDPSAVALAQWGTYHSYAGITPPATQSDVVDLSDATEVAPGTGKLTLYWYPSGPTENGWYSVGDSTYNFGGLAGFIPSSPSTPGVKYSIMLTYIVDFRARR